MITVEQEEALEKVLDGTTIWKWYWLASAVFVSCLLLSTLDGLEDVRSLAYAAGGISVMIMYFGRGQRNVRIQVRDVLGW